MQAQRENHLLLAGHILLAFILAGQPIFSNLWVYGFFFYAIYKIYKSTTDKPLAAYYAAYFVGMEVLLRMTHARVNWEFGKYAVVLILILGLIKEKQYFRHGKVFLVYFLLMVPSLFLIENYSLDSFRHAISWNLAGPMALAVSAYYFYEKKLDFSQFKVLLTFMLLPLLTLVTYLILKTPDLNTLSFIGESNFATSGGYGPNQVSTMLGLGLFTLCLMFLMGVEITGYKILDVGLIFIFFYRILLTFSRGGLIGALGAFLVAILVLHFSKFKFNLKFKTKYLLPFLILGFLGVASWEIVNNISKDKLKVRYLEKDSKEPVNQNAQIFGEKSEIPVIGPRLKIILAELELFFHFPILGSGPDMARVTAMELGIDGLTMNHTEFTRLLGHHGAFGLISLMILILMPMAQFRKVNDVNKVFLASFITLAFFTMGHSSMRLVMPSFIYGLAFVSVNYASNPLMRSSRLLLPALK